MEGILLVILHLMITWAELAEKPKFIFQRRLVHIAAALAEYQNEERIMDMAQITIWNHAQVVGEKDMKQALRNYTEIIVIP